MVNHYIFHTVQYMNIHVRLIVRTRRVGMSTVTVSLIVK